MSIKSARSGKQVDMLTGPLIKKILLFALPLAASSILQQLFNAADSAVVGRFSGVNALAAVGANTSVVLLFIGAITGISVGTNVILANKIGINDTSGIKSTVTTSMLFSVLLGIILMGIGFVFSNPILTAIGAPDEVMDLALLYLRIYLCGMPFISIYNFGAAVMRSIGNTKAPTICLLVTGVLNILMNLLFVIVFHMSVAGVAISTTISNFIGAVIIIILLLKTDTIIHLELKNVKLSWNILGMILKIGIPAAIQSMVFSVANVCIQSGINSFGTSAIAGSAAAINFEGFDFYMVTAFNQAAVTFVGQNYAAGKNDRVKKIYKICLVECAILVASMIIIFWTGSSFWLSLYTTDPTAIEYAKIRMTYALIPHTLICTYEITGSVIRGLGKSLTPAIITVIGSVALRVTWLLTVFEYSHTFNTLMLVYPVSWIVTGIMMEIAYITVRQKHLK